MPDTESRTPDQDGRDHEYSIIVNARQKTVASRDLSFFEIVSLAFGPPSADGQVMYTVTYSNAEGPRKHGTLVNGQSVKIRNEGTTFDVTATDKS